MAMEVYTVEQQIWDAREEARIAKEEAKEAVKEAAKETNINTTLRIARELIKDNIEFEKIMRFTGLTIEKLEELKLEVCGCRPSEE